MLLRLTLKISCLKWFLSNKVCQIFNKCVYLSTLKYFTISMINDFRQRFYAKSPHYLKSFILNDFKMVSMLHTTKSWPWALVTLVHTIIIETRWKVRRTICLCITFGAYCDVSCSKDWSIGSETLNSFTWVD